MLRFIKQHMTSIDGIELFPLISLGIFTLFFAGLLIWVISAKKKDIDEVANYPLS